jgi:ABC-2 type transport system ATP-binding protein
VRDISHNKGLNLILSSHLLPDVENTCDHVVVLDRGAIAAAGPIAALKRHGGRVFELRVKGDVERFRGVLAASGVDCHEGDDDLMRLFVPDGRGPQFLFELAAREQVQVRHLRASVPTLEDVFAHALGEK